MILEINGLSAYAATGNPMASEPDCNYIPPRWHDPQACSTQTTENV